MASAAPIIVEGFITDKAFIDQSKSINNFLSEGNGKVSVLTQKALSYFNTPKTFSDTRAPAARTVNWNAVTAPALVVDGEVFGNFVDTVNALPASRTTAFFKIIDRLFFAYNSTASLASLETYLTTDADTSALYTPQSLTMSTTINQVPIYLANGSTLTVAVPAFVSFTIQLVSGQTTVAYDLTVYTAVDTFLTNYAHSTVIKVIPPLPYDDLYTSSLISATDNIFSTASLSSTLAYNTTQSLFGTTSVSGFTEYNAVLTDGQNSVSIPLNILYKGRTPTLFAIRNAIKAALLGSGVGDEAGWRARIPGVFVAGRFYLLPFWGETYTKPDQIVFPSVTKLTRFATLTETIFAALGFGDLDDETEVLSVYYDRMTATVIPDLSGNVAVVSLASVIPDYQNHSPISPEFGYMLTNTQVFAKSLNDVLALDATGGTSNSYSKITEGSLTFYSFTVAQYEICVVTKFSYQTISGSTGSTQ